MSQIETLRSQADAARDAWLTAAEPLRGAVAQLRSGELTVVAYCALVAESARLYDAYSLASLELIAAMYPHDRVIARQLAEARDGGIR